MISIDTIISTGLRVSSGALPLQTTQRAGRVPAEFGCVMSPFSGNRGGKLLGREAEGDEQARWVRTS